MSYCCVVAAALACGDVANPVGAKGASKPSHSAPIGVAITQGFMVLLILKAMWQHTFIDLCLNGEIQHSIRMRL